MATWATVDDVVAGMVAGQLKVIYFPTATTVAGRLVDLNAAAAHRYGQMATPAAASAGGTLHVDSDAGFPWFTNAAGSNELRLAHAALGMQTAGAIHLYERVWSCSGMDGTLNTAQNVTGFPALTIPDANGTGLELFAEVYGLIGTSQPQITVSYTNSANTAGRTTIAQLIGGTGLREAYRLIPLPLQLGDTGVKSIQSATLSSTTGTAGNFGLVLAKHLCTLQSAGSSSMPPYDCFRLGLPKIDTDAALMFVCQSTSSTSGVVMGTLQLAEH